MTEFKAQTASTNVLADLCARLRTLSLANLVEPDYKLEEGAHVVGVANDDVKLLWSLRGALKAEHDALIDSSTPLADRVRARLGNRRVASENLASLSKIFQDEDAKKDLELVDQITDELAMKERLYEIAKNMFWLAVRRQYPELAGKRNVFICEGWQLGWLEETRCSPPSGGLGIVLGVSRDDLSPELLEALGAKPRTKH